MAPVVFCVLFGAADVAWGGIQNYQVRNGPVQVDDLTRQLNVIFSNANNHYHFQGRFAGLVPDTERGMLEFIREHPPENGWYSSDDVAQMNKVLQTSFGAFSNIQMVLDGNGGREEKRQEIKNYLQAYVAGVRSDLGATEDHFPKNVTFWDLRREEIPQLQNPPPKAIDWIALKSVLGALPAPPDHGGGDGWSVPPGYNGAATNSDPSSHEDAGSIDLQNGDLSAALAEANLAVQQGGGVSALDLRGDVEYKMNNFSAATADAQAALKLNAQDADAQALLHFAADRVDGAAGGDASGPAAGAGFHGSANGGASEIASMNALANSGAAKLAADEAASRARAALGLGDASAALLEIAKGLRADPGNSALLGLRAQIEARRGQWKEALADAQAGLARDPKNLALLKAKALAQLRLKDYNGAIATANEMLELDGRNADAFAIRGQAYGLLGNSEQMASDLEQAAAFDPYYADVAARARAGTLVKPADSDVMFLIRGEAGAAATAGAPSRARRFVGVAGAAAAGGALLAVVLLTTVLAPARRRAVEALSRLTRTGPRVGSMPVQPEDGPAAGLIRGQYELSREIGSGGMGRVFEGTDRSLGRRVAVKKMRDELRADPRERERFIAEAKTVAALHHPNIVDIYAIAEEGPDVYLVFEYVDGKTVHELVYERGRLEPRDAAAVTRACAEALEFAHGRGVIHRDMKPSNVMLDASGVVKVMDFGIARAAKDALTRASMTNTVVGTPPYMAPEQEQGQVRRESDVYALAVCAYEMLCGELPFTGVGMGMSLNKLNKAYEPASRRVPGLPAAVDQAFARAFEPDPLKRCRSPREFAAALDAALASAARA